jgi:SpoVK/Ycf46/Vps4 family AAA+-type ATPase
LTLRGLTLKESEHVLHGALAGGDVTRENLLARIFDEKEKAVRKFGVLEYVRTSNSLRDIGGMEILREWIDKRKPLFTQDAVEAGQPVPRGVLIMGISGCGKSLCAKVIANLWDVPLFRLDMNMVFSGLYGNPHAAFQRALTGIESVAPAVLWIDEIENGLGMTTANSSSEQTLTFSSFLTWMQERPPLIFVAATANRIESLPAEVIRKGRFDEVFFCDLPTDEERKEIIRIHLEHNDIDAEKVDPGKLLYTTRGWSGAEIEQAIVATRIEALHAGREADLEDVKAQMRGMVPLSTTMSEQIRAIREWSHYRARRASKAPPKSMVPD